MSLLYPAGGSTTLMFVYLWLLNNVRPFVVILPQLL